MVRVDRTVHAQTVNGSMQVVRYDRQGRWYLESVSANGQPRTKVRIATVQAAAAQAVTMEQQGGTIFTGRIGGKQFDAKVDGARRKVG